MNNTNNNIPWGWCRFYFPERGETINHYKYPNQEDYSERCKLAVGPISFVSLLYRNKPIDFDKITVVDHYDNEYIVCKEDIMERLVFK